MCPVVRRAISRARDAFQIAGKFSSSQALSRGADLLTVIGRSIFQANVIHLTSICHRNRP
jgi:hypothetical protein